MTSGSYRVVNDGGVGSAVEITSAFVKAREGHDGGRNGAITAIARDAHVSPAQIRAFLHPSRWPKTVSHGVVRRLSDAYLVFLRRKFGELEAEIQRVETIVGDHSPALEDLAVKLADLQARFEALRRK